MQCLCDCITLQCVGKRLLCSHLDNDIFLATTSQHIHSEWSQKVWQLMWFQCNQHLIANSTRAGELRR